MDIETRRKKIKRAHYLCINFDLMLAADREIAMKEFKALKKELGIKKMKEVITWDGKLLI